MGFFTQMAFYPTLGYNLARNKWNQGWWPWYSRIDEVVVLGALPFKSMIPELLEKEQIGGVVCMNQVHEVEHSWVANKQEWEAVNVKYYWLPTPDFIYTPTVNDIEAAVKFIRSFEGSGKSVYVHCKAGRSRSALITACYLVDRHKWFTSTALDQIYHKRQQIILRDAHWLALNSFAQRVLVDQKGIDLDKLKN